MGIRETLNKNPQIATGATVGIIVLAVILIIWQMFSSGSSGPDVASRKAYFTDDDGKTYFEDSAANLSPFKRNGKEAVRAHVYRCSDGKAFVGWMERYTKASRDKLEKYMSDPKNKGKFLPEWSDDSAREIRKPDDPAGRWYPWTYQRFDLYRTRKCRGGADAEEIGPNPPPKE